MSGLLFSGGTVVSAEGSYRADVLVEDEKIVAVGTNLDTEDAETVDASGKLVMPGFIDAHTHMDMPFGGTVTADDWATGTEAAAAGGTTMIIDFALQEAGLVRKRRARGAEPGDFLETNDKTLEPPVLRFLNFDEQGHTNGHHRNAQAPGIDNTFNWFMPGKAGDPGRSGTIARWATTASSSPGASRHLGNGSSRKRACRCSSRWVRTRACAASRWASRPAWCAPRCGQQRY